MLKEQLQTQASNLQKLLTLLQQERSALKNRDIVSLEPLVEQKQLLLQQISEQDGLISQSSDLEQLKEGGSLYPQKQEITQLLKSCKEQNELNGQIVSMTIESNQRFGQLLNNLVQRNSMTYDQKGKTHSANRIGKGIKA